jgi:hypothetical protein
LNKVSNQKSPNNEVYSMHRQYDIVTDLDLSVQEPVVFILRTPHEAMPRECAEISVLLRISTWATLSLEVICYQAPPPSDSNASSVQSYLCYECRACSDPTNLSCLTEVSRTTRAQTPATAVASNPNARRCMRVASFPGNLQQSFA